MIACKSNWLPVAFDWVHLLKYLLECESMDDPV